MFKYKNNNLNNMQHFPLVERLHTDILEEKYGHITSKVLRHDTIREAHLVDSKGISRTYAITFLNKSYNREIIKINKKIKNGNPIGKAFREYDYAIRKNVLDVFKIKIPIWLKKSFQVNDNYAKARLSEFYAKRRDHEPVIYGIVVEIYSPDFRKPKINSVDKSQISSVTECLEKYGFTKDEI